MTVIKSTEIGIITINFSVFTRRRGLAEWVTTVCSTFRVIITFYGFIETTPVRVAINWITSIFIFTFIYLIVTA
jgi:hypothetical protein